MTLGQPIIRVGHGGTASRAAIALNSKGNVTVGYDVGKGAATVLAGDFESQIRSLGFLTLEQKSISAAS
jgi:hypothetical protein